MMRFGEGETYKRVVDMLPYEIKKDGSGENIKKIFKVYAKYTDKNDELTENYGNLLDIYSLKGYSLELIGGVFLVFRDTGEDDDSYRDRIIKSIIKRKTPTTVPAIQEVVDSVVTDGTLDVRENHRGLSGNIYLTGRAAPQSIKRAVNLSESFLPAGVRMVYPIVAREIWGDLLVNFKTWNDINDNSFIW